MTFHSALAAIALLLVPLAPAVAGPVDLPAATTPSAEARAGLAANDARTPPPATIEGRRAWSEAVQQEIGRPRLAHYRVAMAESRLAGVSVRIFTPPGARDDGPVLLNLHGGGFVVDAGSITENAALAALTGYRIVAVRYRLMPDHRFPEAVDDALAVYRALVTRHSADRIAVFGTSAGAILSAELVSRLKAEALPLPAALGFFSGSADLMRPGDSMILFGDPQTAAALGRAYADDPADPLVSPLRGSLAGWPPTLCLSSGRDFLLSATADFCRALDKAGVSANLILFDGLPHAFWSYIDAPETDAAFEAMARFFRARLENGT